MNRNDRRIIIFCVVSAAVIGMSLSVIGPVETLIQDTFGRSHSGIGFIQSAFFLGCIVGSFVYSWAFYRLLRKPTMALALIIAGAGSLLSGVESYPVMVWGRLLTGFGQAIVFLFCASLIIAAFPKAQGRMLTMINCVFALSACTTILVTRPLVDLFDDWSVAFWPSAVMFPLILPLLATITLPEMEKKRNVTFRSSWHVLTGGVFLACALVCVANVILEQGTLTFISAYGEKERDFGVQPSLVIAALYWGGAACSRAILTWVGRERHEKAVIIWCSILAAVFMTGALFMPTAEGMMAGVFLGGFAIGPIIPYGISLAVRQQKKLKSVLLSAFNAVLCVGGAIGPVLVGRIGDSTSLFGGLIVVYVSFFIVWIPLALVRIREISDRCHHSTRVLTAAESTLGHHAGKSAIDRRVRRNQDVSA